MINPVRATFFKHPVIQKLFYVSGWFSQCTFIYNWKRHESDQSWVLLIFVCLKLSNKKKCFFALIFQFLQTFHRLIFMNLNLTGFSFHQASSSTNADVKTTKTSFLGVWLHFLSIYLFRALTPILKSVERRSTAI